jgi:4-hydroxy-4-methyl-2-oxoglutarate aldolase
MKFPVFAGGIGPLDSKGRGAVMKIDVPIECGGVRVTAGDWIFGDGVVVIRAALAEKAVALALEKVKSETTVREELSKGYRLKDVFARHGIL